MNCTMSLSSLDQRSSLPEVHRRIKEIVDEKIAHEALKSKGRPLETKAKYEKLARELLEKQTIVDPEQEKQKEFEVARRAVLELITPKTSPEGREYTDVKFYTGLNDLDSLIEGVVGSLNTKGSWTKEAMSQALKDDFEIQKKANVLENQRVYEKRRDAKRLFLEAYLVELEVRGFTNPEEVKQKLKERLSYIEESLFEAFWKETISSEDILLPVIEKIGDGIENEEVRERFTEVLRSGDISQIFSFLGEQRDILAHTFSKELLPALRFLLSQTFEKQFQKGEYPNSEAFAFFIQFSDSFLSFAPLAVEFYQHMAVEAYLFSQDRQKRVEYDLLKKIIYSSRPLLSDVFKKYIQHLLPLAPADRKIVDTLKKFYFKDTNDHYKQSFVDKWLLIFSKNRIKKFDPSHLFALMHRTALELFESDVPNSHKKLAQVYLPQLHKTGKNLQFISIENDTYLYQVMFTDPQIQFVTGYHI